MLFRGRGVEEIGKLNAPLGDSDLVVLAKGGGCPKSVSISEATIPPPFENI